MFLCVLGCFYGVLGCFFFRRFVPQDIRRAMDLIDRMEEDMDEVLFASVIEACVRPRSSGCLTAGIEFFVFVLSVRG